MRRHWSARLVAMLGAVWFVLVGAEPAGFGTCPAHMTMSASRDGSSIHHVPGAEHDSKAPQNSDSHECTCPGECSGPSAVVVPSEQVAFAPSARGAELPWFAQDGYDAPWTDHVLPFGTAPPQSGSA